MNIFLAFLMLLQDPPRVVEFGHGLLAVTQKLSQGVRDAKGTFMIPLYSYDNVSVYQATAGPVSVEGKKVSPIPAKETSTPFVTKSLDGQSVTLKNQTTQWQQFLVVVYAEEREEEKERQPVIGLFHLAPGEEKTPQLYGSRWVVLDLDKNEYCAMTLPRYVPSQESEPSPAREGLEKILEPASTSFSLAPALGWMGSLTFDGVTSDDTSEALSSHIQFDELDPASLFGGRVSFQFIRGLDFSFGYFSGQVQGTAQHTVYEADFPVAKERLEVEGTLSTATAGVNGWLLDGNFLKVGMGVDVLWSRFEVDQWTPDPTPTFSGHLDTINFFQVVPKLTLSVRYGILEGGVEAGMSAYGRNVEPGVRYAQAFFGLRFSF